jgi:hypothetical protein
VGEKDQQIGFFLSKEFLTFWATYFAKILHLLIFIYFCKFFCKKGTYYGTYIISLMLWFSNKKNVSTIVIEIFKSI